MTYTPPLFSTTPLLGVDLSSAGLNEPFTPYSTANASTPEYPQSGGFFYPGLQLFGTGGAKFVYAVATAAAVAAGDVCYITGGTAAVANFAVGLTSTNAATAGNSKLGVSSAALATSQTGWFQMEGNTLIVSMVTGGGAGSTLHTSATAGKLTSTAVTGTSFIVNAITNLSTGTASTPCMIGSGFSINTASTLG